MIWQQFGAAIDMLENAMRACPDKLWGDRTRRPEFWYIAFHTLFFLDLYLSESDAGFVPPAPFTLDEMDERGLLPDRVYSKEELLSYLRHGREKCRRTVSGMSDERSRQRCGFAWLDLSVGEMLLYNMRHVQHHAAQLNLILRQNVDSAPRWVRKATTALLLCVGLLSFSCDDGGTSPQQGLLADHSGIVDPVKRWQAYGITEYSLLQTRTCFCADGGKKFLITVRSGGIASVVDPTDGGVLAAGRWADFKTIPDLFVLIGSIDTTKAASLQVSYDSRYGYPVRVFVDPSLQMADEEYGFETEIVKR